MRRIHCIFLLFPSEGYLPKENRIFLGDKEMNVTSYSLVLSVMEYQVHACICVDSGAAAVEPMGPIRSHKVS